VTEALGGRIPAGVALPTLPALVTRLDAAIDAPVGAYLGQTIRARGGLGMGVRSAPPLVTTTAYPSLVLDTTAGIRIGPVGLDLTVRNLVDIRNRDAQFEYASSFTPAIPASQTPALHYTMAPRRSFFTTFTLYT